MKTMRIFSILILTPLFFSPFRTISPIDQTTESVRLANSVIQPSNGLANPAKTGEPILPADIEGGQVSRLIQADGSSVVFEVQTPFEQRNLEIREMDGVTYLNLELPGWSRTSQAGAPALPVDNEKIGAPFGAAISIKVTPGPARSLKLAHPLIPAPTQQIKPPHPQTISPQGQELPEIEEVVKENPQIYESQSTYPGVLSEIVSDGVIRQQRVIGVAVYPIQYAPGKNELTIYDTMRVEVNFSGGRSKAINAPASESTVYENFFRQELLNYETARGWRQHVDQDSQFTRDGAKLEAQSLPWTPPNPGWRVKVRKDGFYKLTYSELQSAGLPVESLDPETLQLFYLGQKVAIEVAGEADQKFDAEDAIVFYGQGIDSKYTLDNVYWLTYGQEKGLRITTRDGVPGSAQTPSFYEAVLSVEQNHLYRPGLPVDENMERWIWGYIYPPYTPPSWSYKIKLDDPYVGPAALTLSLFGYLDVAISPDHHVVIELNDTPIGEKWWDGVTQVILDLDIDPGVLHAGENTLTITCPNDTGVGTDLVYIDWIKLVFPNNFTAANDSLIFSYDTAGAWKYKVKGFDSNLIDVYDVTNPLAVSRIENSDIYSEGSGYSLEFEDAILTATRYWIKKDGVYETVQEIKQDTPSDLQSNTNEADYIAIAHPDFIQSARTLRDFRISQGMRAVAVDVQDIYDEFNYGIVGIEPIRSFLSRAYASWQPPAPSFVILIGDGHYDPKNYMGFGRTSFIPPYLSPVDPEMGETAADNRYVTIAGADNFPDMMLGRLSVNSSAEAAAFVDKIISYEQSPVSGGWQKQVLAIADDFDGANNFASSSENLLSCCLPGSYQREKVYYTITHPTAADARSAILNGFNSGKLIINYIGHASQTTWADERLFSATSVPSLTNGAMQPIVLAMTCIEGYFIYPDPLYKAKESLSEVVTRASTRGAIASWSPTGSGVATGHDSLNRGFFEAVFRDGTHYLGQATIAGKLKLWATGVNLDLIDTYLLFGDPALTIVMVPPAAPMNLQANTISKSQIDLTWQDRSSDETVFQIERSTDGVTDWQQIDEVDPNTTNYSDMGLDCGTSFYYRVRAYRAGDDITSFYTNTVFASTKACNQFFLPLVQYDTGAS